MNYIANMRDGDEKPVKRQIGKALEAARIALDLTQEDVAAILGKDRSHVSKWENDVGKPSLDLFVQICALYNISLDALFSPTPQPLEKAKDQDESALLRSWRRLDEPGQKLILGMFAQLVKTDQKP